MTFMELARARFSCRSYDSRMVEEEKILSVLEAARIAPSACNNQPWFFIVVRDPEQRKLLNQVYPRDWFKGAPVAIVACGSHAESWKRNDSKDHCDVDIAIAVDHMTLQATSLGLGTCWICAFDAAKCSKLLGLPSNLEPIVLLPLGYPAQTSDPFRHNEKRKPIASIMRWEKLDQRG